MPGTIQNAQTRNPFQRQKTMASRKCNWRCYEAKRSECRCQCNGVNHGVGEARARENFRRLGLLWNSSPARRITVRKSRKHRVPPEQGRLFGYLSTSELA